MSKSMKLKPFPFRIIQQAAVIPSNLSSLLNEIDTFKTEDIKPRGIPFHALPEGATFAHLNGISKKQVRLQTEPDWGYYTKLGEDLAVCVGDQSNDGGPVGGIAKFKPNVLCTLLRPITDAGNEADDFDRLSEGTNERWITQWYVIDPVGDLLITEAENEKIKRKQAKLDLKAMKLAAKTFKAARTPVPTLDLMPVDDTSGVDVGAKVKEAKQRRINAETGSKN